MGGELFEVEWESGLLTRVLYVAEVDRAFQCAGTLALSASQDFWGQWTLVKR